MRTATIKRGISHRVSALVRAVLMLLALAPPLAAVHAATLFKCQAADAVTSYQSAPCAANAQQVWQRDVTAEPVPRVAASRPQTLRRAAPRSKTVRVRTAATGTAHVNACARARAAAEEERDRHWYTITFDRLRQLDDTVARACK